MAILLAAVLAAGCKSDVEPAAVVAFAFDFNDGTNGCTAGFADYPPGQDGFFELVGERRALVAPVQPPLAAGSFGYFLSGNNHSDDLFTFLSCPLGGLRANITYGVSISVQFATSVPRGCLGVGGSPGESVYMKAGATGEAPQVLIRNGAYQTNFDKGNQAAGGEHMAVLGTIENSRGCELSALVWERKTLSSGVAATSVQVSSSGAAWILAGIDSAFEATTSLYITRISGELVPR
jgi:hypothetical protein